MAVPTTFTLLRTEIQNWAVRSNTSFTNLDENFVRYAENEMNADKLFRFKQMESTVDLVIKKQVVTATVGGTADAITLTRPTDDTVTAYVLGLRDKFTATATNTGAATVNIDAVAATAIRKYDGTTTLGPLEANDIVIGNDYELFYDGTVFRLLPSFGGVPLPSRYLGMKSLYLLSSPRQPIELVTSDTFHSKVGANQARRPNLATTEGDYLIFMKADSGYQARMTYWRGLVNLSADGDTNWLLNDHPEMYLYKSLSVAFRQLGQPATAAMWEASYEETRDNLRNAEKRDRYGSAPSARSKVPVY